MDEREARRSSYPLTIPNPLLQSEAMRQACAERDFQEIFRLVNRRTGSSHAMMAAAIGKMTSSRVSDIIRGARGVRGQQVIERVSDGFGIPGEMLGLPTRPWESSPGNSDQPKSPAYAGSSQETTSGISDMLLVSMWVEGRRQIVPVSRRALLAGVIGATFPDANAMKTPVADHAASSESAPLPKLHGSQIDAAAEHLKEMWHVLVRADNLFGPRHALASVHQQIGILGSLLEYTRGAQRTELLRVAAQYAESAAWLHEDSADMPSAIRWTSQAMEWATEAGDQAMVTWTLFRRSQQSTTKRNAAQTISLAQAVLRNNAVLTAPMRAAAMQQEAHGYALDGDEIACHQRLDEAHEFAASPDTNGDARSGHGDFCTQSYLELQRANCWLSLGRPDLAAPVFELALAGLPDAYQRDRGLAQARLAMAYTGIRKYDEAAGQAASALGIARSSGSARTLYETAAAVNTLGAVHTSAAVSELFDAIGRDPEF
jgi:tetratricopeptide (TPR) repeat protein